MQIHYYGHSTFLIETKGYKLLFDPFITGNEKAKNINVGDINADYILVSHGHSDHLADVESVAKRCNAKVITNYEINNHFSAKGLDCHPINHGGKFDFDFGTVKCVNAIHTSSFPDGSYAGNPAGFVIWNDEDCFYFAGDTGLTMDMKLIPMTCPKLDFAILPIGDNFTMGYEDAVIASDFIQCDRIIGCHFDTFGYIMIDHAKAIESFESKGKKIVLPEIGQQVNI